MRYRDYNKELIKRGEMLIDLSLFESPITLNTNFLVLAVEVYVV
ncbi:MAG: hypothetical protein QXW79_03590 [Thermoplasmata archaeon]